MSQTQWSTVLLGGCRSADGLFDFQRSVLLEPAVHHMLREQAQNAVYIHAEAEAEGTSYSRFCPEDAGFAERIAAANLPEERAVLLFTAPIPTAVQADYLRFRAEQECAESGVVLLCDQSGLAIGMALGAGMLPALLREGARSLEQLAERTDAATVVYAGSAVTSAKLANDAQSALRDRIAERLMARGVTILDPAHTWIAADVRIGAGSCVLPGSLLYPGCTVGEGCTIGPNTVLKRAMIGDRTEVNASQVIASTIGAEASVGPFAYVRPGCTVGDRTKIGDFVELKNAVIGDDTKAAHLTYIGDAEVGARVNFGCGTVVVNYDGYDKHRTKIGDDCFVGCNTNLVAPVQLGNRVLTAAGSTVTDDVPDGAMAIARARQQTKLEWNDERIAAHRLKNKENEKIPKEIFPTFGKISDRNTGGTTE
jgi:UDP-3-O-[3-hydroxymyristoyl] glucosamine N-acyltransferase